VIRPNSRGFTLTELIIATAITSVAIAMGWGSLIQLWSIERDQEVTVDRQSELNRAMDFIVDEINGAESVTLTVTVPGPNAGLFQLKRPDNIDVAYYVVPKETHRWHGPYVLYRKASNMARSEALVDGVGAISPVCLASGGAVRGKGGLKVVLKSPQHLKLCLMGELPGGQRFTVVSQAYARSR
jgi:prepilin-type N-terminal cleavage/methylation domain-containing protein